MNNDNTQKELPGTLAQKLALWADILRDCSAVGLHFAANIYDQERYRRIQDVALAMMAAASGQTPEEIEPLRTTTFALPSPFPVGDGAVIDEHGRILLIHRADNGLWAMPGGALDVGETPAEGVAREVLEETGVTCEPVALVGTFDSRRWQIGGRHHLYNFLFLCRPLPHIERIDPPSHVNEVLEIGWFAEDALPTDLDPGHVRRIPEAFRVWHGDQHAHFD